MNSCPQKISVSFYDIDDWPEQDRISDLRIFFSRFYFALTTEILDYNTLYVKNCAVQDCMYKVSVDWAITQKIIVLTITMI